MITKMTAGLAEEDKFNMKRENIVEFKNNLEKAVNIFCYRCVIYTIPIEYDNESNIIETANLLIETNQSTLENIIDFLQ